MDFREREVALGLLELTASQECLVHRERLEGSGRLACLGHQVPLGWMGSMVQMERRDRMVARAAEERGGFLVPREKEARGDCRVNQECGDLGGGLDPQEGVAVEGQLVRGDLKALPVQRESRVHEETTGTRAY